ncbi:adenylate cyclase type 10-like isoform X2 [Atheta coriaria]|uniref:adenylate cyclase type 10-like isoform X2 n=1 Tax=Dalotia coriaria TaxID=877792 RepID=UPI0031F371F4
MVVMCSASGSFNTDEKVTLNLKTVISCGNISYGIFGNYNTKKSVFIGDAFKSLRPLIDDATFNKVVVSDSSCPHMVQDRYTVEKTQMGYVTVSKISYSSREVAKKTCFDEKYSEVARLIEEHFKQKDALIHMLHSSRLVANMQKHNKFIKSLPVREEILLAPKYWTLEEMQTLQHEVIFEHLTDSQPGDYLTEMKEITCMTLKVALESDTPNILLNIVDDVFVMLVNEIKQLQCVIQNIHVVETGIVIEILFGLLASKRENEVASALGLARNMSCLLAGKTHVIGVSAGLSSGNVFCSVVGHPLRREYVITGRPIQQAFRLSSLVLDKVLCDLKVFKSARLSSRYFKLYKEEEDSEGKIDYLMEYNETFDTAEEPVNLYPLIDRMGDFNLTVAMIKNADKVKFNSVCYLSAEKYGKTTLLLHLHKEAQNHNCFTVLITLLEMFKRPYYCVTEIYRQIYDQIFTVDAEVEESLDIPKVLVSFGKSSDAEDLSMQKYRTLNHFRDIVALASNTIVVFIDNVHYIDQQSLEILELTLAVGNLRVAMAGSPKKMPKFFLQKLQKNSDIRVKELLPMKDRYIAKLACSLLQSEGMSHRLVKLLIHTCEGNPGNLESLLLKLINNQTIYIFLSNRYNMDTSSFYYPNMNEVVEMTSAFPVVDYSSAQAVESAKFALNMIFQDLYDSVSTFLQLILKTASVIGTQFGRHLLRLMLNLPSENDLAQAIKQLFEDKIIICASVALYQKMYNPAIICCSCYFENEIEDNPDIPKYAYCKLMQFKNENLRLVAYNRLPENQRHTLHVMCADVLEKMTHICPSCMRNPSNYYAFFGTYDRFVEYCKDPSTTAPNYYTYARDSYENIKQAINDQINNRKFDENENDSSENTKESIVIDEKYIPLKRDYDPSSCRCLEMLFVIYEDLIRHSAQANETGKMIFYKLKFGLIQVSMRDITGAMKTLHETRELSLVNCGLENNELSPIFRKYHVGKASIGLAICNLKTKNIAGAKSNIILALRQYHVPLLAFSFKHLRFLLRRKPMRLKTLRPYSKKKDAFGWDMGCALFICAKVFSMENNWKIARDCCKCGISLMKANNNNIGMLLDTYTDAIQIFSISGDQQSCERLQAYLVREFQSYYAKNDLFTFHILLDMLYIVLELNVAKGLLKESLCLGYRFMHLADQSKVLKINPSVLFLLCELNIYNLSFQNFIDMILMLYRYLNPNHIYNYLHYYVMCMYCYNNTGFHVREFDEILKFAKNYFTNSTHKITNTERTLKLLIHVHFLRSNRYSRATRWDAEVDFTKTIRTNGKMIKLMLVQMEAYLLKLVRSIRIEEYVSQVFLKDKIRCLFAWLKEVVRHTVIYQPAYYGLHAWYSMLKKKKSKAYGDLVKMYNIAEKHNIGYYKALAIRLRNHWEGGFMLDFVSRPHVAIQEAPTYTFWQFAQFLHSYILL